MKKFMNLASAVFITLFLSFVFFGTLIAADQSVQSPVQAITAMQSMMTTSSPEVLAKSPTFNAYFASALVNADNYNGLVVASNTPSSECAYYSMAITRTRKMEADGYSVCLIRTGTMTGRNLSEYSADPTDQISGHNFRA